MECSRRRRSAASVQLVTVTAFLQNWYEIVKCLTPSAGQGAKTEPRLRGSATTPGVLSGVPAALCPPCTKGDPQDIGHMEGAPCASMQVRHGSHPVAALGPKVPATAARPGSRGAVRPLHVAQLDEPSTSTRDADNLADAVDARPLPQRRGAGAAYGTRLAQSTPDSFNNSLRTRSCCTSAVLPWELPTM